MVKEVKSPKISANKLGLYLISRPRQQSLILRDQKFPPDYKPHYYKEASEAISQFLASDLSNPAILQNALVILNKSTPKNFQDQTRLAINIEAINAFINIIDDINFQNSKPALGSHAQPYLTFNDVTVSVRPEIVLKGKNKKKIDFVAGVKLYFSKSHPLTEEAGGYIATLIHLHCGENFAQYGKVNSQMCMVIDIFSGKIFFGSKSIVRKQQDVVAACEHIKQLWPSIK